MGEGEGEEAHRWAKHEGCEGSWDNRERTHGIAGQPRGLDKQSRVFFTPSLPSSMFTRLLPSLSPLLTSLAATVAVSHL